MTILQEFKDVIIVLVCVVVGFLMGKSTKVFSTASNPVYEYKPPVEEENKNVQESQYEDPYDEYTITSDDRGIPTL